MADSPSLPAAEMCLEGKFKLLIPVWFSSGGLGAGGWTADKAGNEIWGHWFCSCLSKGLVEGVSIKTARWIVQGEWSHLVHTTFEQQESYFLERCQGLVLPLRLTGDDGGKSSAGNIDKIRAALYSSASSVAHRINPCSAGAHAHRCVSGLCALGESISPDCT